MEAAPPSTGYWDRANRRLIVYNRAGKPRAIDPLLDMRAVVERKRRADEEHAAAVAAGLPPPPATPQTYTSLPDDCYHFEDQSDAPTEHEMAVPFSCLFSDDPAAIATEEPVVARLQATAFPPPTSTRSTLAPRSPSLIPEMIFSIQPVAFLLS